MTVGMVFYVIALILFALLGMGVSVVPRAEAWGWFCLALGLMLGPLPWPPWPPR
jgi:hypothetical protein